MTEVSRLELAQLAYDRAVLARTRARQALDAADREVEAKLAALKLAKLETPS